VIESAEAAFLDARPEFEAAALRVFQRDGAAGLEAFVTEYVKGCLDRVEVAYGELVDTLMFKYLYDRADIAPPALPEIARPVVPQRSAKK
jgi:hypothetical protein